MTRAGILLLAALCLPGAIGAQVAVRIVPPELRPGMENLEALLSEETLTFAGALEALVGETLDKPLFMAASTNAVGTALLLPGAAPWSEGTELVLGSCGAAWADSWSAEALRGLSALDSGSDPGFGASVEPLVFRAARPLRPGASPGLFRVGGSAGLMETRGDRYGSSSLVAGAFANWTLRGPVAGPADLRGLRLEAGLDFAAHALRVVVEPGPVYRSVPIDPDGAGPLAPLTAVISVDATIPAGVATRIASARLQATGQVVLFRALALSAGGGLVASYGDSRITLDVDAPVNVEGYLSDLVATPGRVELHGSTAPVAGGSATFFLCAGPGLELGLFRLSLPLAWRFPGGLGAGLLLGVGLP